jgi:transposase-like protein
MWFWDIIDIKTHFLLASHLSFTRSAKDARRLIELALERAGKLPKVVVTDTPDAYLDYVELTFGAGTRQIHAKKLSSLSDTQLIEHYRGTIKDHAKVMRGLKRADTLKKTTGGWLVHYNFFRPHQALKMGTPAAQAGIQFPYKNWIDVIKFLPSELH